MFFKKKESKVPEIKTDGKLEELFLKSLKEDFDKYTREEKVYYKSPQYGNYYFKIEQSSTYIIDCYMSTERINCYIEGEEIPMGGYSKGRKCYKFAKLIDGVIRNTWANDERQEQEKINALVDKITA